MQYNNFSIYENVKNPLAITSFVIPSILDFLAEPIESVNPSKRKESPSKMIFNNNPEMDFLGFMISSYNNSLKDASFKDDDISFEELIKLENLPVIITSGFRGKGDFRNGLTKQGRRSNHNRRDKLGNPMAYDIVPIDGDFDKLLKLIYSNPRIVNWFKKKGYGILEETTPDVMNRTGATGKHLHIGPDSWAKRMFNNRLLKGLLGFKIPYTVYEEVETPKIESPLEGVIDTPDWIERITPEGIPIVKSNTGDSKMVFNNDEESHTVEELPPVETLLETQQETEQEHKDQAPPVLYSQAPKDVLKRGVYAAKYLMANGNFTKELAAAIAGVMMGENGCNPASYMKAEKQGKGKTKGFGYGAGIGSWTHTEYKNKVLALGGYKPYTPIESLSFDEQLRLFVLDSNNTMKTYYDALRRCKTLEDASATAVVITGGYGRFKKWKTSHPTAADAKAMADLYGRSNDAQFGYSKYHWNLDKIRLDYARQVLENL